jgi:hypothetical protein
MGDRRNLAAWLVLLPLTLAVSGQTAGHGFLLYDDDDHISGNPVVGRVLLFGTAPGTPQ